MLQIDGYEAGFRVRCDRFRVHMKQQKCKDSVTKRCKIRVSCMLQIDGYEAEFRVKCDRFMVHMKQQKCKDSVREGNDS